MPPHFRHGLSCDTSQHQPLLSSPLHQRTALHSHPPARALNSTLTTFPSPTSSPIRHSLTTYPLLPLHALLSDILVVRSLLEPQAPKSRVLPSSSPALSPEPRTARLPDGRVLIVLDCAYLIVPLRVPVPTLRTKIQPTAPTLHALPTSPPPASSPVVAGRTVPSLPSYLEQFEPLLDRHHHPRSPIGSPKLQIR